LIPYRGSPSRADPDPALDGPPCRPNPPTVIAISATPGGPSAARLMQLNEPEPRENELLVEMLALGVCGTDREIVDGQYGFPPPGKDWLVLGH